MAHSFVVVDTDVFIWITRGRGDAGRHLQLIRGKRMVVSFATVAELWRGARARGYNERSRERLHADIRTALVVAPTDELTQHWAELTDDARRRGHALGQRAHNHDAWVAATALLFDVPLLTEDGHFENYPGLRLARNEHQV